MTVDTGKVPCHKCQQVTPQMMPAASAETVACNCDDTYRNHVHRNTPLTHLDLFWSLCIPLSCFCTHLPFLRRGCHLSWGLSCISWTSSKSISSQWILKDTQGLHKILRLRLLVLVSFRWDPRPLGNFDPTKSKELHECLWSSNQKGLQLQISNRNVTFFGQPQGSLASLDKCKDLMSLKMKHSPAHLLYDSVQLTQNTCLIRFCV